MSTNDWPRQAEPTNEELKGSSPKFNKRKLIIIGIVAALVLAIPLSILGVASWKRGVEREGRIYQNSITNLYGKVLGDLSVCMENTLLMANIAAEERKSLGETLAMAVSARYTDPSGNPVDASSPQGQAYIMRMMQEAYPNVPNDLFVRLMDEAVGCRKDARDVQNQLRDMILEFRNWRASGDVIAGSVRESFPTRDLKVESFRGTLYGVEAEEFMDVPLQTEQVEESGKNRRMPGQQPFPSSTPR